MEQTGKDGASRMMWTLEPVDAPNIRDIVYERLKEGILSHRFAPGSQLAAREIARQLNTSTTPVVQVLLRLADEGLVEVIPRRGTFVADLSADRIRQLFEAADAIEGYAARLAVTRVTDRDLQDLQEILDASNAPAPSADDGESASAPLRFEKDSQFHCRLVALSGNPYLISMYQKIDAQVWTFVRMRLIRHYARIRPLAAQGHDQILRCLAARDTIGIVDAIRTHNWQVYAEYEQVLSTQSDDGTARTEARPHPQR